MFNAPNVKLDFQIDKELTSQIIKNASMEDIPTASLDENTENLYNIDLELDHGAMVPLYFVDNNKNYKLVHITYGMLSPLELMNFGKCINKAVLDTNKKAVFIASGDLSHRLTKDGPYPYTPLGAEFDKELISTLEKGDLKSLFTLDKHLICEAGECGLRSLYILAGAINDNTISSKLLSYEGPFGVGYGIMEFTPSSNKNADLYSELLKDKNKENERRIKEGNVYTRLARLNLNYYFNNGRLLTVDELINSNYDDISKLLNDKKGVFVSLKINGDLRGCIGTTEPTTNSIAEEIINNSISAALNDPRFSPLRKEELMDIDISVDLLYPPEKTTFEELDSKKYGVIVSCGHRRGLLLPNLEGIDTADKQVAIAMEKGGIMPNENYSLERFKVERFKEIDDGD
ncbi:AmmeMemoRadiSam system protein A [uncultured Clostridium sp.]|uniref:AmmeMemoRadiSam system protein A n=1 Tax=uncultured Clostridium sp. TaxID=59620 RepID=UPI0025E97AEF|nr:AmmeMemoRadiSam system protein A [uncultured Clostridium sp.]